jgi:NADH:ubiquinone oxidoreductase subunit E
MDKMDKTKVLVNEIVKQYDCSRENLMPILQGIIEKEQYLSTTAMKEVAKVLDISASEVYGSASFYSFLDTKPKGKYVIRVCKSIICDLKEKNSILKQIESLLKIKVGETTHDMKFSLLETNCTGWCHKGPAMLINNEVHTELTTDKIHKILDGYIRNIVKK